jgi:TolB protein
MDMDGGNVRQLTDDPGSAWDYHPAWSPDGSRIAFASNRDGDDDIYVMDADGRNVRQLTDVPLWFERSPVWSPDGTRIAFVSDRDYDYDIYVMDADGGNVRQLTDDPGRDTSPVWSPVLPPRTCQE